MGKEIAFIPYTSAMLILHCFVACTTLAVSLANIADESALLAIKHQIIISDPNHILASNWSNTTSYCNWISVYCSSPQHPQRVTSLNLSSMALQGTIPPQIGNLSFLVSIDISNNNFSGQLPNELGKLRNLHILFAQNNHISGSIPRSIGNLSKLEELYLDNNYLTGAIPKEISNVLNLKILSFRMNNLTGSIPSSIFNISSLLTISFSTNFLSGTLPMNMCNNLPKLEGLYLSNNQLSGQIPTSLYKCTEVRELSLSYNEFSGSIPKGIANLSKLEVLYLGVNYLEGEIPHEVFNISSLRFFDMGNNKLLGTLPTSICDYLPSLEFISLQVNQLKGEIPSSLPRCTLLETVSLSFNQFTGSIPSEIGNLSLLEKIFLGDNSLTGTIPPSFGNLSSLRVLGASHNNLRGNVPKELGNLVNLQKLSLSSNSLTGEFPEAIFNISGLQIIEISVNHLSGKLSTRIDLLLPNIEKLYIGANEFSGKIPSSISNNSKLISLDLTYNFFSGYVPVDLGNLRLLQNLGLGHNQLTSEPSKPELSFLHSLTKCRFLKTLWIENNPLNAMLPTSFTNLSTSLESVIMTACQLKGMIPTGIGNLTNLVDFGIGDNDFTGPMPMTLGHLRKLQRLDFTGSRMHGSIPDSICNCASLSELILSSNKISGAIPTCLGNLTGLRRLFLDSNALNSKIPSSLWNLTGLLVLNMSSNFISSHLPLEVRGMKSIIKLDVSKNQLTGNIPSTIVQLQNLVVLSLSKNRLQGSIPQTLGDMVSLETLDLSENSLTGKIPKSMEALAYLKYLNLSFNKLQGAIPSGGPFANFTAKSFMSNDALCGAPQFKVKSCDSDTSNGSRKTKLLLLKYILPPLVATLIAVTFVALLVRYRKRKLEMRIQSDLALPKTHRKISYYELTRATNNFDEEYLVGKGGLGIVYKGALSDGSIIAIKVFNLELQGAFKSFDAECEIMRSIRHRNLVKVISSCSNDDFKALVLEYMPNGSLEKWLYCHNYCLDLVQRLNVMIDVASALDYLHHEYITTVVHCDLKPSNVLLDEEMIAHVGDFGIAKLLTKNESMVQTKTLGTIGYMAPEYGSEGIVSTMGDVYSYGIMLMEAFTRKKPTDEMFAGELNLKNWVGTLAGDVMELVDANLLNREDEHFTTKEECVSSIMTLALECTAESPEERISMKDVAGRLKKIRIEALRPINTRRRH